MIIVSYKDDSEFKSNSKCYEHCKVMREENKSMSALDCDYCEGGYSYEYDEEVWKKSLNIIAPTKDFKRKIGCELFTQDGIYKGHLIGEDFYCFSNGKEILSNTNDEKYWEEI